MTMILRPWAGSDAAALSTAWRSTPDLTTQLGGAVLADAGAAEAFIADWLPYTDVARNWAVVRDGAAVGNVGLSAIERRHDTAWVSYWLSADARGRGHATRALATVASAAFRDGLARLELGHRRNNPASCAVATRAGFAVEGLERRKLRYGDERFDVETHARLDVDPGPAVDPFPIVTD